MYFHILNDKIRGYSQFIYEGSHTDGLRTATGSCQEVIMYCFCVLLNLMLLYFSFGIVIIILVLEINYLRSDSTIVKINLMDLFIIYLVGDNDKNDIGDYKVISLDAAEEHRHGKSWNDITLLKGISMEQAGLMKSHYWVLPIGIWIQLTGPGFPGGISPQ